MAKQPPKRPRAAAKAAPKPAMAAEPTPRPADIIPPEVHVKDLAPSAAPDAAPQEPVAEQPAPVKQPAPHPAEPAKAPAKSGSIFLPLLLGGIVAGGIGFAAAYLMLVQMPAEDNNDLTARLAALEQQIAAMEPAEPVDLSGLSATQDDLANQIAALQDDLANTRSDLDARMTELADRPAGDAADLPSTDAFAADLDALRAELSELTDMARTELDSARAEAARIEENAAAAARREAGRAALARLRTGVETGAPLGDALADLEPLVDDPLPDSLTSLADGVPTLAAVQDAFPEQARAALTAARRAGVAGEETTGFTAFLRNQFQVRSTTPREGDSVDAILSRAEMALRNSQISDALDEISTVPDMARAEMSDWITLATARADAMLALETLDASLRDN